MSSPMTYVNRQVVEPILKPRQRVKIEPIGKYGVFEVAPSQAPEFLPPVTVNLASYTNTLAAYSDTGSQTTISNEITDWDLSKHNLAQYYLVAVDDVLFSVNQPTAVGRFVNKNGVTTFGRADTQSFYKNQMWGMLPQIFVFEDQTSPVITATPKSYRTTAFARLMAFGYRYILTEVDDDPNMAALTIRVEGS